MSVLCSMVGASFSVAAVALVGRVANTLTAQNTAAISTTQSQFGGASLSLNGSSSANVATSFAFGTGAFTVEYWVRSTTLSGYDIHWDLRGGPTSNLSPIVYTLNGVLTLDVGATTVITGGTLSTNTWYHIALSRSGSSTKLFINGTQTGSTYTDTNNYIAATPLYIGQSSGNGVDGFMDEFRISNSARYTANFTPSTTAFVNDANTQLLVHFDGTNGSTVFTDDNSVVITPAAASVNEGSSITFNVTTAGATDQTLFYTLSNAGDFATSSGSFSLASNAGSFSVTPTADTTTEGAETFTASVRTDSTSGTIIATSSAVTINDTSLTPVANAAVVLNGSNQYYNTSGVTTTATDSKYFTFACTFYMDDAGYPGGTNLMHLVNVYLPGGNSFYIWINGNRMQTDGGCGTIYEASEQSITAFAYNQVVFYFDSSSRANSRVYVNGVSKTLDTGGNPNNTNINWGATGAVVTIGRPNNNIQSAGAHFKGRISQLYLHNASGAPTISNYWDSGTSKPKDLGTQGTATGLVRPLIYHYGTTATFATNNGTGFNNYTLTANGTPTDGLGPTYA